MANPRKTEIMEFKTSTAEELIQELKNTKEGHFTPAAVAMALTAKNARRDAKKKPRIKSFILNCANTTEELAKFLSFLSNYKENLPNNLRFQVALEIGEHWTTLDIRLKNKQYEFFILDAADDRLKALATILLIRKMLNDVKIIYSGYLYVKHIGFEKLSELGKLGLQTDGHNCATFMLDHLFLLSKIPNLHDILPGLANEDNNAIKQLTLAFIQKTSEKGGLPKWLQENFQQLTQFIKEITFISPTNFNNELGPLLRNTQRPDFLACVVDPIKLKGNDTKNLLEYFSPYLVKENGEFKNNTAIIRKRENIKTKTLQFFDTNKPELSTILHKQSDYTVLLKPDEADLPTQLILIGGIGSQERIATFKNITPNNAEALYKLFQKESGDFQNKNSHIRKYKDKPVYTITQQWLEKQNPTVIASLLGMSPEAFKTTAKLNEKSLPSSEVTLQKR